MMKTKGKAPMKSEESDDLYLGPCSDLYVVCHFPRPCLKPHLYSIYRINVRSVKNPKPSDPMPLSPIISLSRAFSNHMAIVVFVGHFFLFGGDSIDSVRRSSGLIGKNEHKLTTTWTSDVYGLPLGRLPVPSTISVHVLPKYPPMKAIKIFPAAVILGDSHICVFSQFLHTRSFGKEGVNFEYYPPNFEVYNVFTKIWSELPEPFDYSSKSVTITSFVTRKSTIYIATDSFGISFIDINCRVWRTFDSSSGIVKFPFIGSGIMINDLCISSGIAFDMCTKSSFLLAPKAEEAEEKDLVFSHNHFGVVSSTPDNRVFTAKLGFVDVARPSELFGDHRPHLYIDIYDYVEGTPVQNSKVSRVNALRYYLTDQLLDMAAAIGCFPAFPLVKREGL